MSDPTSGDVLDAGADGTDAEADEGRAGAGGWGPARVSALVVGVVLLAFVVLLFTREPQQDRFGPGTILGRAAPEVSGRTLTGETVDIDDYRGRLAPDGSWVPGRWVVVNFFATWCIPCREEHPELVRFHEEHRAKGDAEVVSIAYGDTEAALRAFFEQAGGDWPVIVGDEGRTAISFGVTGVPESYVVNPDGVVVAKFEGVTQAALDEVLADPRFGGVGAAAAGGAGS